MFAAATGAMRCFATAATRTGGGAAAARHTLLDDRSALAAAADAGSPDDEREARLLEEKKAVRVLSPEESRWVRQKQAHRIIGSAPGPVGALSPLPTDPDALSGG